MKLPPVQAGMQYCDVFMCVALEEASRALAEREVPVGAVLVHRDFHAFVAEASKKSDPDAPGHETRTLHCSGAPPHRDDAVSASTDVDRLETLYRTCRSHTSDVTATEDQNGFCSPHELRATPSSSGSVPLLVKGRNATNRLHHALAHAEFLAAEQLTSDPPRGAAVQTLAEYVLYVSVEPCIMCAAFLRYNRIGHVYYGIGNPRFGGNGSVLSIHQRLSSDSGSGGSSRGGGDAEVRDGRRSDPGIASSSLWTQRTDPLDYTSEGGHRAEEAVELLQRFYMGENPNAPGDKRKRKRPVA